MKIGFVGLGSMGRGLCRNLLRRGHELKVFNRSPGPLATVAEWGATPCHSAQEAASDVDAVFFCLSSITAEKAMTCGAQGVFASMRAGTPFFDLGTWDMQSARELADEAELRGVSYVALPMGKGPEAAEAGETPLFFGGSRDVYDQWLPLLKEMGHPAYMGDVEHAYAFKLITNLMGLTTNVVLTEGIRLAKVMGIEEKAFLEGGRETGAYSYQFWNSGHKIYQEAFLPMRGTLDNAWKDMKFGVEMATHIGQKCPFFTAARDRYREASEKGYGSEDYIAVYRLLMSEDA